MIKVYVAGAYSGNNVFDVLKNIGRGEYIASELFQFGYAPFTPWHDKNFVFQNFHLDFKVERFYNYSMEWLKICDAVLIVPNFSGLIDWQDSKGTLAEIAEAEKLGIPVFYTIDDLDRWRKENENRIREI